jgi:hypothetical protein
VSARPQPVPVNPALLLHAQERRQSWEKRAGEERQVLAHQQWQTVPDEEQQSDELLGLSTQILELTKAIHAMSAARTPDA